MASEIGQQMPFVPFVCIIESPSAVDVLEGRKEGDALSQSLRLAGIQAGYFAVSDEKTLDMALEAIRIQATPLGQDGTLLSFPMLFLHFSCHGNEDGIGLTNGDFIGWKSLGDKLVNLAVHGGRAQAKLFSACLQSVCMSACGGFHAQKMAEGRDLCPFFSIVGSEVPVQWSDSLTAFTTFYHLTLMKGYAVTKAVPAMNAAAGMPDLFKVMRYAELGFVPSGFMAVDAATGEVFHPRDTRPESGSDNPKT